MNAVKVNGETVSTYTYNENRNLIERTDAEGNVYTFDYNADGQLVGQSDPEGAAFHYVYDENGRLEKTIDGNGNVIMREYGVTETSSSGSCTSCGSTPLLGGAGVGERLQKIIYPTFIKEFRYDDEGRVSEEMYTFNGGETSSVSFDYDVFGRLQSTTGPDNRSTTYVYDLMGRRIRVEDPSGATTFEYDTWDNLIALTDAKNQRTAFEYDTLSRLKKEIRPMSQETTYEYNEKGQLWKMVDAKNQMTEYGYDGQGRLETISYADGKTVILNYDPDGNLAGYSDGETSAEYEDDDLGRKIWEKVNYGDFTKEFSYTYYKNGLKKTLTMPDGTMYEYAYGNNNELREVQIPGLGAVTIPDYTWNRPAKMTFPGGTQRTYGYDALMRLQALTVTDPGGNPLLDYQYTYHEVGHIMTKATEHGNYSYDYDASSRLTGVDNPVLDDESYTSDAVGNRLTSADVSGSWSYNANNELLGFADVEYTYDANGNMTQITVAGAVVWTYVYDAANRLKHVEDGTGVISADYYYDPFGRRLWKDVGGTRTYFFYSEEGLIGEYDASGNAIKTYGYKPDSTWTTDPLFMKQGTDYYFYQNDHLGTPQKLVAMNGAVVWSAQYNAFGEADVQVETVTNNLRFPGQYADAETGLYYNYFRYYDPRIGRYLRPDPIGFVGGDINWYGWIDPINSRDPFGLVRFDEVTTGAKKIVIGGSRLALKLAIQTTMVKLIAAGKVLVAVGAGIAVVLYPRTGDITVQEEQALLQVALARHQAQHEQTQIQEDNNDCSPDDFGRWCNSRLDMKDVLVRVSFAGPHVAIELSDFERVEGWYPHGHHDDSLNMEMDIQARVVKTRLYHACPDTIDKLLQELNKSDDTRSEYSSEEYDGYSPFNVPRRNCAGWVCVILRKAENHADLSNLPTKKIFLQGEYLYAPSTNPTKICETHGLMPYHFLPGGERIPPITAKEDFNTYRPLINELFYQTP